MKYYKTITVLKQQQISFIDAREHIIWRGEDYKFSKLSEINEVYLDNIINYLKSSSIKSARKYHNFTQKQWLEIFEEELAYRKPCISYNDFIKYNGEPAINIILIS